MRFDCFLFVSEHIVKEHGTKELLKLSRCKTRFKSEDPFHVGDNSLPLILPILIVLLKITNVRENYSQSDSYSV